MNKVAAPLRAVIPTFRIHVQQYGTWEGWTAPLSLEQLVTLANLINHTFDFIEEPEFAELWNIIRNAAGEHVRTEEEVIP